LARFADHNGKEHLMQLIQNQYAFAAVLDPLLRQLDQDRLDQASRWWPLGPEHHVVLDPERSLGQPIIKDYGVPTHVLHAAHLSGDSDESIAGWYEVPVEHVRDAIAFESARTRAA
jgi:uncharacterized protein (DUF433 family)